MGICTQHFCITHNIVLHVLQAASNNLEELHTAITILARDHGSAKAEPHKLLKLPYTAITAAQLQSLAITSSTSSRTVHTQLEEVHVHNLKELGDDA